MAAGQTATSKIGTVKIGSGTSAKKKFIATKVTQSADTKGDPTFTKEIIRYINAKGESGVTIGTQNPGETLISPSSDADSTDKIGLGKGGAFIKLSITQMESIKDSFGLDGSGKDLYNSANGKSGQALVSAEPEKDSRASGGASPWIRRSLPSQGSSGAGNGAKTRVDFPKDLKYPVDIGTTSQDVIKFDMLKYEPKKTPGGGVGFGDRSATDGRIIGTCFLPIPAGIQDQSSVSFEDNTLNALQAAAAVSAMKGLTETPGAGFQEAGRQLSAMANDPGAKEALAAFFTEQALSVSGLITRSTGQILNPNMELLFKGPTLRTFNFAFTMSARNQVEGNEIIKILRFFKQGSAVQKSDSNLFLKSPHTFKLKYLHRGKGGEENKAIGKVKECFCTSVQVGYTPHGQYATFPDGRMASYSLTLGFKELEPVFNSDYVDDSDQSIGF